MAASTPRAATSVSAPQGAGCTGTRRTVWVRALRHWPPAPRGPGPFPRAGGSHGGCCWDAANGNEGAQKKRDTGGRTPGVSWRHRSGPMGAWGMEVETRGQGCGLSSRWRLRGLVTWGTAHQSLDPAAPGSLQSHHLPGCQPHNVWGLLVLGELLKSSSGFTYLLACSGCLGCL